MRSSLYPPTASPNNFCIANPPLKQTVFYRQHVLVPRDLMAVVSVGDVLTRRKDLVTVFATDGAQITAAVTRPLARPIVFLAPFRSDGPPLTTVSRGHWLLQL